MKWCMHEAVPTMNNGHKKKNIRIALAFIFGLMALAWPLPALANGEHDGTVTHQLPASLLYFGMYSLAAIAIAVPSLAFYLNYLRRRAVKPSSRLGGYLFQLSLMSRNAKLFLLLSLSSWLGTSVWAVIFNLYLLSLGFDIQFVGLWLTINMFLHGLFAIPSGVIADHIGRRNTFLLANLLQVVSRALALFTVEPTTLLVLAGVIGFGDGAHAVAGAPFMMENSQPEERPHLFSLDASLTWTSRMAGSVLGGVLPIGLATVLSMSVDSSGVGRLALLASLPITLLGLLPIYFIKETRPPPERREKLSQFIRFRHLEHGRIIGLLTLTTVLYGFGFGFTIPFFNVFFNQAYRATADQVGFILALGAGSAAFTALFSPMIVRRFGKVKGLFVTQLGSFPLLFILGAMPNLQLSVIFFFLWRGGWSFSLPLRNQFSMEIVSGRERATTNGIMHGVMDLVASPAAAIAGFTLATGNYILSFGIASIAFMAAASLWLVFFSRLEPQRASPRTQASGT